MQGTTSYLLTMREGHTGCGGRGPLVKKEVSLSLTTCFHQTLFVINKEKRKSNRIRTFTQNTREEVRYIGETGDIAGALAAEPGAHQQTYILMERRKEV